MLKLNNKSSSARQAFIRSHYNAKVYQSNILILIAKLESWHTSCSTWFKIPGNAGAVPYNFINCYQFLYNMVGPDIINVFSARQLEICSLMFSHFLILAIFLDQ